MPITLLDIYNKMTAQSWSIFETDLEANDEIEKSVIIAIQKALRLLWNAHPYSFRLKKKEIYLNEDTADYKMPDGNIVTNGVRLIETGEILQPTHYSKILKTSKGQPKLFYIKYNRLNFYPVPDKEYLVSVDYNTFKLGRNSNNESVFNLNKPDDYLNIPEMFEDLFMNALLNKSMTNALTSSRSELYQPYLQQFIESYKDLIMNSSGLYTQMEIKW